MRKTTMTNKNGLVLTIGDRISTNGKAATIVGFNRDMIEVKLDIFPDDPITVDASFKVEKLEA